jgi:hypothetical protein
MTTPDTPSGAPPSDGAADAAVAPGARCGGGAAAPASARAVGGTLAEYGRSLARAGLVSVSTDSARQLWVPGARGELVRLPPTSTEPVPAATARQLLGRPGIWLISHLAEPDVGRPANCYLYVCRDPAYDLGALRRNARRVIKRGLRHFVIRRCTWDEMAQKGLAAILDTRARHGQPTTGDADFHAFCEVRRRSGFHEAWGAWQGDELAAWTTVIRIDDWAMFDSANSRTAFLSLAPNNVLRFHVLRLLLVEERRRIVSTGISSADPTVDARSMHEYFTRLGFEALPRRRVFVPHPLLRPWVATELGSLAWDRVAAAVPQLTVVQKLAGLARHVSGRARLPQVEASAAGEAEGAAAGPAGGEGE